MAGAERTAARGGPKKREKKREGEMHSCDLLDLDRYSRIVIRINDDRAAVRDLARRSLAVHINLVLVK